MCFRTCMGLCVYRMNGGRAHKKRRSRPGGAPPRSPRLEERDLSRRPLGSSRLRSGGVAKSASNAGEIVPRRPVTGNRPSWSDVRVRSHVSVRCTCTESRYAGSASRREKISRTCGSASIRPNAPPLRTRRTRSIIGSDDALRSRPAIRASSAVRKPPTVCMTGRGARGPCACVEARCESEQAKAGRAHHRRVRAQSPGGGPPPAHERRSRDLPRAVSRGEGRRDRSWR